MTGRKQGIAAAVVVAAMAIVASVFFWPPPREGSTTALVPFGETQALLRAAGGYVALPIPDSKYEPGAIVQWDPEEGLRYVSHLRECRYPTDILEPVVGTLPALMADRTLGFGVEMLATLPGVGLGPDARRVHRVGFAIDAATAEAFDPIRLGIWEDDGANYDRVPEVCRGWLSQKGIYVVAEAVRVHEGTYSLYDSARAQIRLDARNLRNFLDLEASADIRIDGEGRMVVTQPVTIAIRRAFHAGPGFDVLGGDHDADDDDLPTADAVLDSLITEFVARRDR